MSNFLIAILLGCIYALPAASSDRLARMIGAQQAQRNQFPYVVSIQVSGGYHCSGTIISASWVISAAYGFVNVRREQIKIIAGMLTKNENRPENQARNVAEFFLHRDYNDEHNDVSLMKVSSPFVFGGSVKPIDLLCNLDDLQFGGDVWSAGWGSTTKGGSYPSTLQYLQMSLITMQECRKLVGDRTEITGKMICGYTKLNNQAGCSSDEGSPLVQNDVLIGFKSAAKNELCPNDLSQRAPYVCMSINEYIPFIIEMTKEEFCRIKSSTPRTNGTTSRPAGFFDTPSDGAPALSPHNLGTLVSMFGLTLGSRMML